MMKGFIKSKLVLTFITMIFLAGAIAIPLSSSLIPSQAFGATSATPTVPSMKLPWDKSLTNIPFTGGPHSGRDVGASCAPEPISRMSGVDFGLSSGTNVLAVAGGKVFLAGPVSDSRGPYIVGIDHGGNFATEYWHLSSIASSIKVGVSVTQGTILAKSGAPPSGPPHLHLEFRTGSPNYLTPLSAHGMPIDGYTIWTYVNTSTGLGYNYQGTMTRGTTINQYISACRATGVKTWYSQTGPTVIADVNRTGGYLTSTNSNITEFPIPTSSSDPVSITTGPDGNLWFTEFDGHKIGKVTPDGTVNDFLVPTNTSSPWGITSGPDGNLWFTEQYGSNKIGKSSTSGTMPPEYPVTTGNSNPTGIVTGPDGNLWFAEAGASQIGVMSTSGTMLHEYPVSSNSSPFSIIVGPDSYLYFTEYNGSKIGKMSTNGTIIGEYPTLTGNSNPSRLTTGPDGNIWFTEQGAGKIGKMSTSGAMLGEYSTSNSNSNPVGITTGPDGNVWFVELYGSQIGKITPSGTITEYSLPSGFGYPVGITLGPDGNLWFTEAIGNAIGRFIP